jgi:hypothetical protein
MAQRSPWLSRIELREGALEPFHPSSEVPDSASLHRVGIFQVNAPTCFTEEERAEVVEAIRAAIDGDRYVLSPWVRRSLTMCA